MFCSRGQCIPYTTETFSSTTRTNPCDIFYRPGIDYVYLPSGRALGDLRRLNDIAADLNLVNDILPPQCRYNYGQMAEVIVPRSGFHNTMYSAYPDKK